MSAFIDTSVWFAAAARRHHLNERAKSILGSIDQHLTTDLVLAETWQLLKAQFSSAVADMFWERLRHSGVRVETVVSADLDAASEIETNSPEESFSFVDRTSFAVMERMGISRVATFNSDFAAYQPRSGRRRPFQILCEGHSAVFTALRQALLERRTVQVSYRGERQTICPYILGHGAGEERAFALAVEVGSSTKHAAQPRWICLRLAKIENFCAADQPWVEQDYRGPVQRCVDQVHLDARRLIGGIGAGKPMSR